MDILKKKVLGNKNEERVYNRPTWTDFGNDDIFESETYNNYEESEDEGEKEIVEKTSCEVEEDDEDYDDEDYGDEDYDDEDYDDEDYDDEDYDDEDYDDEDYDDEDYDDEDYDDEDGDDEPEGIAKIAHFFMNMSMVDHVVAFTGVIILVLAVFTGVILVGAKAQEKQVATFGEVGEGVEEISVIGEDGLLAIADAQQAKLYAAQMEEGQTQEPKEGETEQKTTKKTEVLLDLTSIQKDLKIKFTNKKSGKLIPNVVFEVEVTKPSGNTYILKDEDKDGIIYEKNIESGKYKVAIIGPDDLKDYSFSKDKKDVTVKDTIEYKKVDVSNEVKDESQVNAAKEDTKVNETVVESENTDTVEWVESTKTLIAGTEETVESYEEVGFNEIADPGDEAALSFRLLTEEEEPVPVETEDPGDGEEPQETKEPEKTKEPEETEGPKETEKPEETEKPKETATPKETPGEVPKESQEPTPTGTKKPTDVPKEDKTPTPSATPTATPTAKPSATPTKTPKEDGPENDRESNLKTKDGEQLYVKDEGGNYRKAKYADYYDDLTFYRKIEKTTGEYRYTGWQTIDGSTYFFDKNGNKVTGVQVIQGAKYTFNDNGVLDSGSGNLGIDVSKWNGNIDWNAVKNSGVSYVIIRCGYRGSATGVLVEDPKFRSNINGALNAGLKVGVYFFSQATNEVEAVEEASMALGLIKGYNITFPVFLDVEATDGNDGRADGISVSARTAVCKAFCQTIQNSGYKAGIYANKSWFTGYIDTPSLTNYKIWLAQYAAAPSYTRTKYDMWQYSSKGRVAGISGNVDMNISYLGY